MSSAAQLAHLYRYPFASYVEPGYGLRLATSGTHEDAGANPYFFEGRLERPDELADMLLLVSEVVRSRFYLPGAMRDLDPVVTCTEEALRFEGFSSCCGVYARADFSGQAFESGLKGRGTTNVDFNAPMRGALGRLRTGREARLAVGAAEVKLTSSEIGDFVEKKVKLPHRWIKGFSEVQSYSSRLRPRLEVPATEAQKFLRSLPRGGSPKRVSYVVASGKGLRLTSVVSADGVRILGAERLRLLEPLAGRARQLRVWSDEATGVSAWELVFETGWLWLTMSPDLSRGFSGEGQLLGTLASGEGESTLQKVRAELRWRASLDVASVAERVGSSAGEVAAALGVLSARGLVGFDVRTGSYFHRELPFDLERVAQLQPRLRDARELVAGGKVRWKSRGDEGGDCLVQGTGVEHFVRIHGDDDRCTCRWFSRYQGERGPCKHILAARIDLDGETDA